AMTPINAVFRRRAAASLTVLAYHGVDDPETFRRHLGHISRRYRPLTVDELVSALTRGDDLQRGSLLITFDDGHRSVLEVGLPLLRERGLPAAAFIVSGLVDSDEPYWWDEVDELIAAGGTAGPLAGVDPAEAV